MPDPEAVEILETHEGLEELPRRGACLVCGEWLDLASEPGYSVSVEAGTAYAEYVAHRGCLASVVHEGASLPAIPPP